MPQNIVRIVLSHALNFVLEGAQQFFSGKGNFYSTQFVLELCKGHHNKSAWPHHSMLGWVIFRPAFRMPVTFKVHCVAVRWLHLFCSPPCLYTVSCHIIKTNLPMSNQSRNTNRLEFMPQSKSTVIHSTHWMIKWLCMAPNPSSQLVYWKQWNAVLRSEDRDWMELTPKCT